MAGDDADGQARHGKRTSNSAMNAISMAPPYWYPSLVSSIFRLYSAIATSSAAIAASSSASTTATRLPTVRLSHTVSCPSCYGKGTWIAVMQHRGARHS